MARTSGLGDGRGGAFEAFVAVEGEAMRQEQDEVGTR
jgi:hypothetical protein